MVSLHSSWRDQEVLLKKREDRRVYREWLSSLRASDDAEGLRVLADMLSPVFRYLADGLATSSGLSNHSLEHRAWVLLYAVRPDLIAGESMSDAAKRMGVTKPALHQKLALLRAALPSLKIDTESRKGHAWDKGASSLRKTAAQKRNWAKRKKRKFAQSVKSVETV